MDRSNCENAFRIFTSRTTKHIVRFLVSPSVVERIPFVEELLMRAAAGGGTSDKLVWPESIIVSGEDELLPIPADCLHVVLPNWFLERVKDEQQRRLPFLFRVAGDVATREVYWSFAWVLGHYLEPLQKEEDLRKNCRILINVGLFFPVEYRPIRVWMSMLLIVPYLVIMSIVVYGGSTVWRSNRKFLYAKGNLDMALGRRRALAKTRQRLLNLGETAENLKELTLTPDLRIVKEETQKNSRV